ncbi:hypothetical protein GOP47_0006237 [Adiantum capillus-veneris]|uniref:Uncharacterized protein n=1 Tax=Adiantum capillus-veneris TaxID=13818 RepID=A0A9D4ZMB6_ADICA|nr:hypothetical protein GOP47_0006237 [Adiantum capillus-veneris]
MEANLGISDASSDMSDYTSEEADEFEDIASEELKNGKISLYNNNGELWCPFCSGKKKSQYKYAELIQHATGVSKGKRGVEAAGKHRALLKHVNVHMSHMAEPPKERVIHLEQETPATETTVKDEKLVWPWMGVIVNIDNSKVVNGKRVGPGDNEIKTRFSRFHPKCVNTKWNFHGHQGIAILEFENDMIGYGDAQDFERSFLECGRGRREWERRAASVEGPGKELYGWVANQQDYNGEDLIGKHLRDKGNLRTVAEVNEAWSRQKDQLLQNLDATIQDQHQKLQDSNRQVFGLQSLVIQTERARQEAEMQRVYMEEVHKQELLAVVRDAKRTIQMREDEMKKEREKLGAAFQNLQIRCQELESQEVHDDIERMKKEIEMNENEKKMQLFFQIQELHKAQEAKKLDLIRKQKGESSTLLQDQHRQQKLLLNQHKLEQEIQALEAILESKKLEANENKQAGSSLTDLEGKLEELKAEKELLEDMHKTLTYRERALNDEVQNAKKAAVKIFEKKGTVKDIGVKKMGELDQAPWRTACKQKFKNSPDGWDFHFATEWTTWDKNVRDVQWHPFKVVEVGDERHELRINENDDKLMTLRSEYGEAVFASVINALKELQEHNASGRKLHPRRGVGEVEAQSLWGTAC